MRGVQEARLWEEGFRISNGECHTKRSKRSVTAVKASKSSQITKEKSLLTKENRTGEAIFRPILRLYINRQRAVI